MSAPQTNTTNAPISHVSVGMVIDGKYKVLNKIGQGGMSVVWLVMNERANKQWAIKEVRKDGVDNYEIVRQSLIAETEYLKRLSHPNLPSIVDIIDTADSLLIVMDYVEGISLSQALRERGALPQAQVVAWAKQLCAVLGYLHSRNPPIIYRDLKPANIMLQPDGTVKIIDFGTAREFKEGRADDTIPLGTQGYAAPEQYGNHQTDARTDIYNLGATVYHLVTGHNPSEPPYVIHPIRQWNPNLSSGLEAVIAKCTSRDPDDRYQNMAELLFDLERYRSLDEEYIGSRTRKWRLFLTSAIITLVFILATVGFGVGAAIFKQGSYDNILADAASSATLNQALFLKAAALDPTNPKAYQVMLDKIMEDTKLSDQESVSLRELFNTNDNLGKLKSGNAKAYGELMYKVGTFSYFNTVTGSKDKAIEWLTEAGNSTELDSRQANLASLLANIGRNKKNFEEEIFTSSKDSMSGAKEFTPRTFWDSLIELSDGDLYDVTNNNFVCIMVYDELVTQIYSHPDIFARGHITEAEMSKQLDKAASGIQKLLTTDSEERELIAGVQSKITDARSKVVTAVQNVNYGGSSGTTSGGAS